ncbi:MAG: hypothetical protein ACLUD0_17375 [Eubacterium ramulus]
MDNSSPKKGDIRYIPLNWTVINTNVMGRSTVYRLLLDWPKSGDYTLKVAFAAAAV